MSRKPRVLVVDRHEGVCDVIREFLDRNGFDVHCRRDQAGMREALAQDGVDLVILDPYVADDGIAASTLEVTTRGIPVIVTAPDGATMERIARAGFPTLLKPFHLSPLLDLVRQTLERRAAPESSEV